MRRRRRASQSDEEDNEEEDDEDDNLEFLEDDESDEGEEIIAQKTESAPPIQTPSPTTQPLGEEHTAQTPSATEVEAKTEASRRDDTRSLGRGRGRAKRQTRKHWADDADAKRESTGEPLSPRSRGPRGNYRRFRKPPRKSSLERTSSPTTPPTPSPKPYSDTTAAPLAGSGPSVPAAASEPSSGRGSRTPRGSRGRGRGREPPRKPAEPGPVETAVPAVKSPPKRSPHAADHGRRYSSRRFAEERPPRLQRKYHPPATGEPTPADTPAAQPAAASGVSTTTAPKRYSSARATLHGHAMPETATSNTTATTATATAPAVLTITAPTVITTAATASPTATSSSATATPATSTTPTTTTPSSSESPKPTKKLSANAPQYVPLSMQLASGGAASQYYAKQYTTAYPSGYVDSSQPYYYANAVPGYAPYGGGRGRAQPAAVQSGFVPPPHAQPPAGATSPLPKPRSKAVPIVAPPGKESVAATAPESANESANILAAEVGTQPAPINATSEGTVQGSESTGPSAPPLAAS